MSLFPVVVMVVGLPRIEISVSDDVLKKMLVDNNLQFISPAGDNFLSISVVGIPLMEAEYHIEYSVWDKRYKEQLESAYNKFGQVFGKTPRLYFCMSKNKGYV